MPFRVAARTVLQLGAELISSDAVAFFELIKNSFDAGSPRVEIEVVVRIPPKKYQQLISRLSESRSDRNLEQIQADAVAAIDRSVQESEVLDRAIHKAKTKTALEAAIRDGNFISVK